MKYFTLIVMIVTNSMLLVSTSAQNIPDYVPTNELIGWWPFNGNANDLSGNGKHGVINGALIPVNDRYELPNAAFQYSGNTTFIDYPNTNSGLGLSDNVTLSLWIKHDYNTIPLNNIWFKGGSWKESYLYLLADGKIRFSYRSGGTNSPLQTVTSTISLESNVWYHIVFVIKSTSNGIILHLYKNGELNNTASAISGFNWSTDINTVCAGVGIRTGKHFNACTINWGFNGVIDDIGIWNRALTANEIQALYNTLNGDANCDGVVDILDVVTVINDILELNPSPYCDHNADVNADGTIDILDAVGIINMILFFDDPSCPGTPTLTDADGNVYNTIQIGNQCWMAENLKTTQYRNSTPVEYPGADNNAWQNNTTGAYAWYDNDISWKDSYGALYNWHAVNNNNGLCPTGWHVPSDAEWTQLVDYVAAQGFPNSNITNGTGNALKSCRQVNSPMGGGCNTTEHPRWDAHSTHHGFDEFVFSALPGGRRLTNDGFGTIGMHGYWWSSTEHSPTDAWYQAMSSGFGHVARGSGRSKGDGFSIRCLKNTQPTLYNLILEVEPADAATVSGAGVYEAGNVVNIIAISEEGWVFVNWTGDTDHLDDPNNANTAVTMPANNITLTANFEEEEEQEFDCGEDITFLYRGDEVTYGTILRNGLCWFDRNLGAVPMPFVPAEDATGKIDTRLYGDLFQWGRLDDGHQDRQSSTTPGPVNTDVPGHSLFISVYGSPGDWRSPKNDNLWQGEDGINNPCPLGWRLPNEAEFNAERESWLSNNSEGAYQSTLKWSVGGRRHSYGTPYDVGTVGWVWSSTVKVNSSQKLVFNSTDAAVNSSYRADGMSVRCVRNVE